ncbi:hypothetical protein HPP92_008082 [Vanilla planifolia]|uniref:Uncharacterized protein n=1 Tax=Vanilla planifolia TaxID=51239 RepID=A0A835RNK7_VANPL|nr:hypothetical protein HPP92_008249 [Vanilla planifolia]KAG0491219.1 hypothetical protein HPP92_008082 [Vanilla planifolia]
MHSHVRWQWQSQSSARSRSLVTQSLMQSLDHGHRVTVTDHTDLRSLVCSLIHHGLVFDPLIYDPGHSQVMVTSGSRLQSLVTGH